MFNPGINPGLFLGQHPWLILSLNPVIDPGLGPQLIQGLCLDLYAVPTPSGVWGSIQ